MKAPSKGLLIALGGALAVGREAFSAQVTRRIEGHPLIEVRRQEVKSLPQEGVAVVATGPLTSDSLAADIARLGGGKRCTFTTRWRRS